MEQQEEAVQKLIEDWYIVRRWAERFLCDQLGLSSVEQISEPHLRGIRRVADTEWWYRTHGIGVDLFKEGNHGGIDFDFEQPDPDIYRMHSFMVKQYNDGSLTKKYFQSLLQDDEKWKEIYTIVMSARSRT